MEFAPKITDKFLPEDLYKEAQGLIRNAPWTYGARSNAETDPHGHLSWKPYHDKRENIGDISWQLQGVTRKIWDCVGAKLPGHVPVRIYANGYSYGMDGYFHKDSSRDGEVTAIIYICDGWNPDWAGETCCYDSKGTYWSVLPAPNRLMLLPSNMLHCARAVSRKCTSIRTVLVFKTRPPRTRTFEELSSWLIEKGALSYDHSKGSLHDHLMRTYQLLEDKRLPQQVCLGGGLHSVYGTNIYKKQLLEPNKSNREMVQQRFGKEAEEFAYAFATLNRPKVFEAVAGWEHSSIVGACMIEAANLFDQDSLNSWPGLYKLWTGKGAGK